ncbi:unnamed protein product, partial [Iphiclides podalirius]
MGWCQSARLQVLNFSALLGTVSEISKGSYHPRKQPQYLFGARSRNGSSKYVGTTGSGRRALRHFRPRLYGITGALIVLRFVLYEPS